MVLRWIGSIAVPIVRPSLCMMIGHDGPLRSSVNTFVAHYLVVVCVSGSMTSGVSGRKGAFSQIGLTDQATRSNTSSSVMRGDTMFLPA